MRVKLFLFLFLLAISTLCVAKPSKMDPKVNDQKSASELLSQPRQNEIHEISSANEVNEPTYDYGSFFSAMSVLIASLGVLLTIMTIIAAIIFFFQSRDYKNRLVVSTNNYKQIIQKFIDSKEEEFSIQRENIDRLLAEYKQKLNELADSQPDQVDKIKNIITELENKKLMTDNKIDTSVGEVSYLASDIYSSGSYNVSKKYHKCSNCGFGFILKDMPSTLNDKFRRNISALTNFSEKVVTCPKCGNADII